MDEQLINALREHFEYNENTGMLIRKKIVDHDYKNNVGDEVTSTTKYKHIEYYTFRFLGNTYKAHRVIWAIVYGYMPDTIDHRDGNGLNNKLDNLREVTQASNCKNRRNQVNSSTGYSGITVIPSRTAGKPPRYLARINPSSGKRISLGRFDTFEEAVEARKKAEVEYGYHTEHCTR